MNSLNSLNSSSGFSKESLLTTNVTHSGITSQFEQSVTLSPSLNSPFRKVFKTTPEMKNEFVKFLKTIFYILDEEKVIAEMDRILSDPNKTDEDIYKELQQNIGNLKKRFPLFHKIKSLFVLKNGMKEQIAELTQGMYKKQFQNYLEIYDRRYFNVLKKIGMPLKENAIAVCDTDSINFTDRLQAGSVFSKYPYQKHVALNDPDCENPLANPEKTHLAINEEKVANESIDVIACLGGLHHVPLDRVDAFTDSLHRVLKPGGLLLFRDHDANKDDLEAIASVVHSFVNITEVSWEVESKEIRNFKSMEYWKEFLKNHGFSQISTKQLVLKDDPTANTMVAFIKTAESVADLQETMRYRCDYARPKQATRSTWIEWGNVRFSEQYAEFIQDHDDCGFDYIGHFRQHWQHFYHFVKECINDKEIKLKDLIFSDDMAMNLFILTTASIQCSLNAIVNLPNMAVARWKHGKNWRSIKNLNKTDLERFHAKTTLEYSQFIQHTPFYMFDNIGKIKEMWRTIWSSKENLSIKLSSTLNAMSSTLSFLVNAAISTPVRAIYTSETNQEPDTIQMIIKDPNNELQAVINQWEQEKDIINNKNHTIKLLLESKDGHKLISVPRYRPFTKICSYMNEKLSLCPIEIGGQKEISIDVLFKKGENLSFIDGTRVVYELEKLQDTEQRRYVTYQVQMKALKSFHEQAKESIIYIHA
jgi:SAM-dependent methyltransferase